MMIPEPLAQEARVMPACLAMLNAIVVGAETETSNPMPMAADLDTSS
ncbi:MAG: hypothetical protein FD176_3569 [Rhodospirillaceae bacterium]|nr:MAG: hypothetical protein FD176_3569 [Rhodospirillaceae bacterium]